MCRRMNELNDEDCLEWIVKQCFFSTYLNVRSIAEGETLPIDLLRWNVTKEKILSFSRSKRFFFVVLTSRSDRWEKGHLISSTKSQKKILGIVPNVLRCVGNRSIIFRHHHHFDHQRSIECPDDGKSTERERGQAMKYREKEILSWMIDEYSSENIQVKRSSRW